MNLESSIIATLAYHSLFEYPLNINELHNFLISKKTSEKNVVKNLKKLKASQKIEERAGYFFLAGERKIVSTRQKRTSISQKKLKRAKLFANILKAIPSIKMIAISGALSMENSKKDDDIDLVIVTSKDTLWSTRFFANTALIAFKRNPRSKKTKNKACLNIFIEEPSFRIKEQNIYTAHEICQMKPIWDKGKTYSKFIRTNKWVFKYLPNWQAAKVESRGQKLSTFNFQLSTFENLFKKFQLWYMRNKVSTETIGDKQLFFHPKNTQEQVVKEFNDRLTLLKIKESPLLY